MKNGNRLELNRDKPLLTVTVGEFADLLSGILGERRECREGGLTAKGLGELAERLVQRSLTSNGAACWTKR